MQALYAANHGPLQLKSLGFHWSYAFWLVPALLIAPVRAGQGRLVANVTAVIGFVAQHHARTAHGRLVPLGDGQADGAEGYATGPAPRRIEVPGDDPARDKRWVEQAGQKAVLCPGDPRTRRTAAPSSTPVQEFGRVDVLVGNAAFQMTGAHDRHPRRGMGPHDRHEPAAFFHLAKAAVPHMPSGSSIIGSSSVNSISPSPGLMPYAMTKAGIANMCASLAQLLGQQGIRVNSVAPGPVWTPLIPSTMPPEKVESFGQTRRWAVPGSPPSWPRCTCCSPRTRPAMSPVPGWRSGGRQPDPA